MGLSFVDQDSPFEWNIKLSGLENTCWQGAELLLRLYFHAEYNLSPPEIYFITVPFHPNIDVQSGRICIPWIDNVENWNPNTRISELLLYIQLLVEPMAENPVNLEAYRIYNTAIHLYEQIVRDSVVVSKRLFAGAGLVSEHYDQQPITENASPAKINKDKNVLSFEGYYSSWKYLATSSLLNEAQMIESYQTNPRKLRETLLIQRPLWYGNIKNKKDTTKSVEAKNHVIVPIAWKTAGDIDPRPFTFDLEQNEKKNVIHGEQMEILGKELNKKLTNEKPGSAKATQLVDLKETVVLDAKIKSSSLEQMTSRQSSLGRFDSIVQQTLEESMSSIRDISEKLEEIDTDTDDWETDAEELVRWSSQLETEVI